MTNSSPNAVHDEINTDQSTSVPAPIPSQPTIPLAESFPQQDPALDATKEAMMNELLGKASVAPPPTPTTSSSDNHNISPKPKTGLVMAVLATVLLVLPVGVYYISQQNQQIADTRSKATGPPQPYTTIPPGQICENVHEPGGGCECKSDGSRCCGYYNEKKCCDSSGGGNCHWYFIDSGEQCSNGPSDQCTGTNNTPTPTTAIAPICQNLKIYKGGVQVATTSLSAGDDVVLAVKGNLTPNKAHFRINGGAWQESAVKNASNEFTLSYTIPAGVPDFVIEAEVFTNGAWY